MSVWSCVECYLDSESVTFLCKNIYLKTFKIILKLLKPPDTCQLILWFLQWNQIRVNLLISFYVILKFEYLTFGLVKHNKHAG